MLPSFAEDVIEVESPVWVLDSRNTRRPTFPVGNLRTRVPGCSVQPGASAEILAGRTTTSVRWTVFAPPGTAVEATDTVMFEGTRYAVDGEAARHRSPTGATSHVMLLLLDWK